MYVCVYVDKCVDVMSVCVSNLFLKKKKKKKKACIMGACW